MEYVVDHPGAWEHQSIRHRGDDFCNLEGSIASGLKLWICAGDLQVCGIQPHFGSQPINGGCCGSGTGPLIDEFSGGLPVCFSLLCPIFYQLVVGDGTFLWCDGYIIS